MNMSEKLCLQWKNFLWKSERRQWLCWCDPGLWGWPLGGSSQGDLGNLQSRNKHPHPLIYLRGMTFENTQLWTSKQISKHRGFSSFRFEGWRCLGGPWQRGVGGSSQTAQVYHKIITACLICNNHQHPANKCNQMIWNFLFRSVWKTKDFADVTLACEDGQ